MTKKTTGKRPKRARGKPARQKKPRKAIARAKPLRIVDVRRKPGRPSPYVPEYAHIAGVMAKIGATDFEIAEACGVAESTVNNWKARHPEFLESIKAGIAALPIERVERSLYHRAIGYRHEATKVMNVEGELVAVDYTEHYPPDTAAARLWLLNKDPLRWRDRHEVAATVTDERTEQDLSDQELIDLVRREQARRQAALEGQHLESADCWCREPLVPVELRCKDREPPASP